MFFMYRDTCSVDIWYKQQLGSYCLTQIFYSAKPYVKFNQKTKIPVCSVGREPFLDPLWCAEDKAHYPELQNKQ